MTLPSSGPISMSQMRNEYGLSNPVSMSQFYGKPGIASSGPLAFSSFYGKSNYIDRQTVTVGQWYSAPYTLYGYSKGFGGAISDGISDIYAKEVTQIRWSNISNQLIFSLGSLATNSGWSKMVVGTTVLDRAAATYSTSGNASWWLWSGVANPFGGVGSQTLVGFIQ